MPGRVAAACLLALLLLAGLAPATPAQADGDTATIGFVDADRLPLPPGSRVLGTAASAQVHVRDPAAAGRATVEATVISGRDLAGERIVLARDRDPAASGADFYGAVAFGHSVAADDGLVAVEAGDEVSALYGATTVVRTPAHALVWDRAADAVLALSPDLAGAPGRAVVTLTDGGADVASAASVPVRVASASDPLGFTLPLLRVPQSGPESGSSSSGSVMFRGQFTFKRAGNSSEAPLLVSPGDAVTVRYRDLDAAGRPVERTAAATWRTGAGGVLSFTDAALRSPSASFTGAASRPVLRYEDADLAGAAGVDALVRAASAGDDPSGVTGGVPVRLQAVAPGEFVGAFGLALDTPAAGQLHVAEGGDTLVATVRDPQGTDGLAHDRTASATWVPGHSSVLRFRNATYSGTPASLDAAGRAYVELEDADLAGSGLANATATSDRDPVGLRVGLRETGSKTGLFRGCLDFQTVAGGPGTMQSPGSVCGPAAPGAASAGRLLVRAGDSVRLGTVDARSDHGPNATTVAPGPALSGAPASPGSPPGHIEFKACRADCSTPNPVLVSAGALSGAGRDGAVFVEVQDASYDLDPASADAILVQAGSSLAANAWDAAGKLAAGQGLTVAAIETAPHSAVFRGRFGLSTTTPSATALLVGGADADDVVVARYGYAQHPANAPAEQPGTPPACGPDPLPACAPADDRAGLGLVQAVVPWHRSATASVRFADPGNLTAAPARLRGLGPAVAQVRGLDSAEDRTAGKDSVVARVRSDSDLHGIQVTFTERRAHATDAWAAAAGGDGFVGSWSFTDGPSDEAADRLKVAPGDVVSIEYADPQDASGLAAGAVASIRWAPSADGTLAIDQALYRGAAGAKVTVTDADLDANKSAADRTQVLVQALDGGIDADGLLLDLTETAASSGVFTATLPFQDPPVPGDGAIGPGDGGHVRITSPDALDAHGANAVASRELQWFRDAHGGLLLLGALAGRSGRANVTLADPDLDATTAADLVDVRVASASEPAGERLTLAETGASTGAFAGNLSFATAAVPGDGKVAVKDGDLVTVSYFDACASAATACNKTGATSRGRSVSAVWHESRSPSARLAAAPANGTAPLNVTLTPSVTPGLKPLVGYRLDFGDASPALVGAAAPTTAAHVYASPGVYVARLQATDASGVQANASLAISVAAKGAGVPHPPSPSPSSGPPGPGGTSRDRDLADLASRIQLTVRRDGDANVLSWSLPSVDGLQGVQVWRSNSPYELVRTLPVGSSLFKARGLRDEGASALATTTYLVTMYFGTSAASGYFGNGTAPDPALYPSHAVTAEPKPDPAWVPWAIGAGVVLALAAAVVAILLVRRRNLKEADEPTGEAVSYPWDSASSAAGGPSHPVQCPRCETAFTATGPRPLLSICPSCGYRNVLP